MYVSIQLGSDHLQLIITEIEHKHITKMNIYTFT